MRTENEIISKLNDFRVKAEKDESYKPFVRLLEWIVDGKKDTNRENELFNIYHSKLRGKEKATFNALRRYEAKIDRPVTLDEVKSASFMHNSNLLGFGSQSLQKVLKNPEYYLF